MVAAAADDAALLPLQRQQTLRNLQATTVDLYLVDADTDLPITMINDGDYISLPLSVVNLNIEAIPAGSTGSASKVRFGFNDNSNYRTEGAEPFAFCGDAAGDFKPCGILSIDGGVKTVTATVLDMAGGVLVSKSVTITVSYGGGTPSPLF